MDKYIINGGKKLCGEVDIQGSKNSALAILFACLLCDGEIVLSNLPHISDTEIALQILMHYGAEIKKINTETVKICTKGVKKMPIPKTLTSQMRASGYLLGALVGRFGECELPDCGGCNFGNRPIDLHLDALKVLGAYEDKRTNTVSVKTRLEAGKIDFPKKTVGGTVNAILASVKANGKTTINNAAKEPHITDLCEFLNKCGANISGAGSDTIKVIGTENIGGCLHVIDGDMIEAGTFMLAALACRGNVRCNGIKTNELAALTAVLKNMGAEVFYEKDSVTVYAERLRGANVKTEPYPGFPTDLQPQMCALLGLCEGESSINENIFKNRFAYLSEMKKCGINNTITGNIIKIIGRNEYMPASYMATDLRGGAAMVICALAANGKSEVGNIALIKRGYSFFEQKLTSIGASIVTA